MLKVAAVSFRPEIRNMLQRYVGGILKNIGTVKGMTTEEAIASNSDLYVVYTMGPVYKEFCKYVDPERVVQAKLFPMPAGIKNVMMLPEGSRIGIVAGHRWDAADFLAQLITSGVRNYLFSTGSVEDINSMAVDYFVVPEEISPYIKDKCILKKTVVVARTLDSQCVATIIQAAMAISR